MNTYKLNTPTPVLKGTRQKALTWIKYICLFLFAYAAYAKIVDHTRFLMGLEKVHILFGNAAIVSVIVPVIEVVVIILLIVPETTKAGLWAFTITMCVFTTYIISAMIWEPKLPCRCGGAIEKLTWTQHIWFNLAFIILSGIGVYLTNSIKQFKNTTS